MRDLSGGRIHKQPDRAHEGRHLRHQIARPLRTHTARARFHEYKTQRICTGTHRVGDVGLGGQATNLDANAMHGPPELPNSIVQV